MVGMSECSAKFLYIALREGANCAVYHATEHAGGVLDGFATAELEVVRVEKHHAATEFADAGLEGPRVRVEDLVKIIAHVWPASGWCWLSPRCALMTVAFSRMVLMDAVSIASILNRCFAG